METTVLMIRKQNLQKKSIYYGQKTKQCNKIGFQNNWQLLACLLLNVGLSPVTQMRAGGMGRSPLNIIPNYLHLYSYFLKLIFFVHYLLQILKFC